MLLLYVSCLNGQPEVHAHSCLQQQLHLKFEGSEAAAWRTLLPAARPKEQSVDSAVPLLHSVEQLSQQCSQHCVSPFLRTHREEMRDLSYRREPFWSVAAQQHHVSHCAKLLAICCLGRAGVVGQSPGRPNHSARAVAGSETAGSTKYEAVV